MNSRRSIDSGSRASRGPRGSSLRASRPLGSYARVASLSGSARQSKLSLFSVKSFQSRNTLESLSTGLTGQTRLSGQTLLSGLTRGSRSSHVVLARRSLEFGDHISDSRRQDSHSEVINFLLGRRRTRVADGSGATRRAGMTHPADSAGGTLGTGLTGLAGPTRWSFVSWATAGA